MPDNTSIISIFETILEAGIGETLVGYREYDTRWGLRVLKS